jgi:hypothetical protein
MDVGGLIYFYMAARRFDELGIICARRGIYNGGVVDNPELPRSLLYREPA